mgnify:CR=1 FL=1
MTAARARQRGYVDRLSAEDRATMLETEFACAIKEPKPRKERARKPAPPHPYRPCRIYTSEGMFVRCSKPDCQDDSHRVRATLS